MQPDLLHDRDEIARFLRSNAPLHLYALGDLDDFFWPYTTWYGLREGGEIRQIVLLYRGGGLPVLLALAEEPAGQIADLLRALLPRLPQRFYAHLSPGLGRPLESAYHLEPRGIHLKMILSDPGRLEGVDTAEVEEVRPADRPALEELYRLAYPGNWFDPRMLETGLYRGIRRQGRWVSVAGVHVYSARYGVAALGNVATHPAFRGQGLATKVCADLCRTLLRTVRWVGLNVGADNAPARACYERLGFTVVVPYEEAMLSRRSSRGTLFDNGEHLCYTNR